MPSTVFIVDDERNIRRTVRMVLEGEGYAVEEASSGEEALARIAEIGADVMLLDVQLPGMSGLETIERIAKLKNLESPPTIIMISGHATLADAVRATKAGAYDLIEKPLDRERLMVALRNALERRAMEREVQGLRAIADERFEMVGKSAPMAALFAQIAKVAPSLTGVLITGESGTGKELFARERGAFTGAVGRKRGHFEMADGGTIFLDEVGDMIVSAQAKVLRVLQSGEFTRVGGEQTLKADVRVIAATNRDLQAAVASGHFREDLYFRLAVVPLRAPPLRERAEDVTALSAAFVEQACRENGMKVKTISPVAVAMLAAYPWPGNVRELRNVIERLVILSDEGIGVGDLPEEIVAEVSRRRREAAAAGPSQLPKVELPAEARALPLREFRDHMEREYIRMKLDDNGWNISRTASLLGIERTNLHKKMRALGLSRDRDNQGQPGALGPADD